jgi:hypothetical protein
MEEMLSNINIAIEALMECANPKGAYDTNRLRHAENTIRDTSKIAQDALHIEWRQ